MPLIKTFLSKVTEDLESGLPLWNGNPWPSGGSATSIDWNNVFNKPFVLTQLTEVGGLLYYKNAPLIIDWVDVLNKPMSTVENLDDAVDKKHEHNNQSILDKIDEDTNGKPTWDGSAWPGGSGGLTSVNWANVNNRPASSVTDIDDAVSKKHGHTNKTILDNLNENLLGELTYKGIDLVSGDMKKSIYDTNNNGIVDEAETLRNLTASIVELNYLGGAKSNIQAQIDALSNVANFTGTITNYSDLSSITNPNTNDMTIVLEDENNDDKTTIYMFDGTNWIYVGEFKAELRDFTLYPINLATEVTGILNENLIDSNLIRKNDFTNSLADIDDAASKRHEHTNKTELDKINVDTDGNPIWNGNKWPGVSSWNELLNKPISSVIDIDDAVSKKHEHINNVSLDKIGTNINNSKPTWNGLDWPISDVDWTDIKNAPISSVGDIDDAVTKKHEHNNILTLDNLDTGSKGDLIFSGISLDDRYVNITGDTMTGDLILEKNLLLDKYKNNTFTKTTYLNLDKQDGKVVIESTLDQSNVDINDNIGNMISIHDTGYIHSSLIPNNALKQWISGTLYYEDDIVVYNNKLWKSSEQHQRTIFDTDIWMELTGFMDEETVYDHIMTTVQEGVHGFPIATVDDEQKIVGVDANGAYTLIHPDDLGLDVVTIGPNPLSVYTPSNYASVLQPSRFEFNYYHPLGTAAGGLKIDVYENKGNGELRPVYTTDWLPPMRARSLPYGLLNPSNWYVAYLTCRDMSGRLSEPRIINFRAIPANLENITFANYISAYGMYEDMGVGENKYLFLQNMDFEDMLAPANKPTPFTITSDHTAIFVPDDITGNSYESFTTTEYTHPDNVALEYTNTRFKDSDNNYYANHTIWPGVAYNYDQFKTEGLEANKQYTLQIYKVDKNLNSRLSEQEIYTYNIDHLRTNRVDKYNLKNTKTLPTYCLEIPSEKPEHLGVSSKPKPPQITNANELRYVYSTDHINLNVFETILFTYEHGDELNPLAMQRGVLRFKKDKNEYHSSQEFFGENNSIIFKVDKLESGVDYTLELYVVDTNMHINFTTIPVTTLPVGQYNYTSAHYSIKNNDINVQSSGIVGLLSSISQNPEHLGIKTKPDIPIINNTDEWRYLYPTDHVNINNNILNLDFIYNHKQNYSMIRSLVRFKKNTNEYHCSQEFFNNDTNPIVEVKNLETNTNYILELYVMDENMHINKTTIPVTILPDGQYNYTKLHYSIQNDDIFVSSTGILSLDKGVR